MKPTIKNAKTLGAHKFGWAGFKHQLMRELGIPSAEFNSWCVPLGWKNVFLRANGRAKVNK